MPARSPQILSCFVILNTQDLLTNLNHLVGAAPDWSVVLPLGISFFTFTQIAYLVDCARGMRGKHNFLDCALFVSFFPHLLAGPIIHHSELIPQLVSTKKHIILLQDVTVGALVFVIGLAKKIILADQVAPITNTVFSHADAGHSLSFFSAWIGAVAFTMQIYFDFSGYSDMAVGVARMFGIRFPWNFDSPYRSTTIVEFWRRWHMTLSRWLRDYLYFPLGGFALARHGGSSTCLSPCCSAGCGMVRIGTSLFGAGSTAHF